MTTNQYIESVDLYLIDGVIANYELVHDALIRLSRKKNLQEIEQFEDFIVFLVLNNYLAESSAFLLRLVLKNLKVILERELDMAAAELRA
jgi:hypothetical protein